MGQKKGVFYMPKKGENIRKRKDGRWEGRYTGKDGKTHSVYGKTYKETKEKLCTERIEKRYKTKLQKTDIVYFELVCDEWLKKKKLRLKESSYATYYTTVYKHLIPVWRNKNIHCIDFQTDIQNLIQKKQDEKLSSKRIKEILCRLEQILIYAEQKYNLSHVWIEADFADSVTKEVTILSEEEQKKLSQKLLIQHDRKKLGILLSLYLGLRIGEVCALQWSDIDFQNGTIHINKTLQRVKCFEEDNKNKTKIIMGTPKSIKSRRTLPLPFFLFTILKEYRSSPNAFILTGTPFCFIEPRQYENIFKTYLKELSIRQVNYHSLRHTFATRAVEKEVDIKTLSELLGHSSVSVTLQLYVHPSMKDKAKSIEKIAG